MTAETLNFLKQVLGTTHRGHVILSTMDPSKPTAKERGRWQQDRSFRWPGQARSLVARVEELADQNLEVYFSQIMSGPKISKDDAVDLALIHADLDREKFDKGTMSVTFDGRDQDINMDIAEKLGACVVATSKRNRQVYLRLTEPVSPEKYAELCRRLGYTVAAFPEDVDAKVSPGDVLRMPGTYNLKPGRKDAVHVLQALGTPLSLDEVEQMLVPLRDHTARKEGDDSRTGVVYGMVKSAVEKRRTYKNARREIVNRFPGYEEDHPGDIEKLWEEATEKEPPESTRKERAGKTQMATPDEGNSDHNTMVDTNGGLKLRKLNEMTEKIFEPVGVGLFESAVTVLLGSEESLKTTLSIHIMAAIATGKGWEPFDIPPGDPQRVALIVTEPSMVKTRLGLLGVAPDSDYLQIFTDEGGSDFPTFPNDTYSQELEEFDPQLVVLDMWADTVDGLMLKDGQQSLEALRPWVSFASKTGASVLLLAHTNRSNGQAMEARDIYGLTSSLRKKARVTLLAFVHPDDGSLYVGVEKANIGTDKNTHTFRVVSADTGLTNRRGEPVTVPQLAYIETLPERVWSLFVDGRAKKSDDRKKPTVGEILVEVLRRGHTPRPQAIKECQELMQEKGFPAPSERAIDNAWRSIVDDGQAGQARRNAKKEKMWSLSYANREREADCSGD